MSYIRYIGFVAQIMIESKVAVVRFRVTESDYHALSEQAKKEGYADLSKFLRSIVNKYKKLTP